jgi:methyl-accepting chemotaxis protein
MLRNMKLGVRLGAGFSVVLALTAFMVVYTTIQLNSISADTAVIVNDRVPQIVGTNQIINDVNQATLAVRNMLILDDRAEMNKEDKHITEAGSRITKNIDRLTETITTEEGKRLLSKMQADRQEYLIAQTRARELLLKEGRRDEARKVLLTELSAAQQKYTATVEELIDFQVKMANTDGNRAILLSSSVRNALAGIAVAVFLLGALIALFITLSIVRPIERCREIAEKIARGETGMEIAVDSKDETGSLMAAMKNMTASIRKLITDAGMLSKAAVEGKLSTRADAARHEGDFRKIVQGVNDTLDAVIKPVEEASVALEKMANNDFTASVTGEYHGDHARIKVNINRVLDILNESLGKVAEVTTQVASSSQQLSSTAEEMSAGAEQQTTQTQQVATSVEEMTVTVQEVAKNSTAAAQRAADAGETAVKGGEVVDQTVSGMARISESVRELQNVINELTKNSEKIGNIIGVIDDVADQTNLLALNAAIEAARAGEQGRGFAVVADEVRKLAERTTASTKEIASMVKSIQEDTAKASGSMDRSAREVENGMSCATTAGQSLKEIVAGARIVTDMVKQIAGASEQQAAAAEEISSNMESIASVSKQNAAGAQQTSSASQELSSLTEELQKLVNRFRLREDSIHTVQKLTNEHSFEIVNGKGVRKVEQRKAS